MANKTLIENHTGNWATPANWSPSGVPVNGDHVRIPSGSVDITSGLNQSAVTVASLRVGPGYTGSIPTALQINVTELDLAGRGNEYALTGTFGTVTITDATGGDDAITLNGAITTLRVEGGTGTITIVNDCPVTTIHMINCPGIFLDIGTEGDPVVTFVADSGEFQCARNITALTMNEQARGTTTGTAAVAAMLLNSEQCVLNYNSSGTAADNKIRGGLLDLSNNQAAAVTLTTTEVWSGGFINARTGLQNLTFTNGIVNHGFNNIAVDPGLTYSFA